ncbi:MAG TPA: metalloregulator ArsR/SmtB family transcription factor [Candidatus Saccharimonadales bacterium]|nr:metalloregulator ArsR/SmtB family transcription factor [Candidatus Saccharimonadales bacterium]
MTYTSFDHFFQTLANKQRVHILQLLADKGPLSVSAIAEMLGLEQSSASHSLKQLLLCHFVAVKQIGKERIYAINEDTVKPLFDHIQQHVSKYCVQGCDHWE